MQFIASRAGIVAVVAVVAGCSSGRPSRPEPAQPAQKETVTSEDLATHPNEPIEIALQKKVPGAIVTRTSDGGIALQIRGVSSFEGRATPPLYIVDDSPFTPGPGGALSGIDPHEIESIKVLKGASAGIYGIDGANGVIVVKTKRGGKPSKP
ncbi:MAG TPA: TonB-dependent receptor plug domain-containing protein [Gemmatimonadaceae bacterium]|jgi:TonB-dependent SusC/RagA subfamily outer membrane receptor